MSLAQDLAAAFAELELTVPVEYLATGAVARAFFDRGVEVMGTETGIAAGTSVVHFQKGAFRGITIDEQMRIGQPGALAVRDCDPVFVYRGPVTFSDDGAFDHFAVVEA